ncbi:MAG: sigma-70 family RNA polymerase sigma factor [Planctomycetales bacterium]|nr:sigma-70 family RNA polymerase sigma factor [Planctomycetales bacterium]MCA9162112.1 sigma-70 family RNA polymerase sigma factor [Planctomycetales bacterium]MCA9203257.1 sigma-70 family RNA polymerase sigma factor [Planctomycetales bacterium]
MWNDPGSTSPSLIDRLQQSADPDDDAWNAFFLLYHEFLTQSCQMGWRMSSEEASDFAHDVLLKVREKIGSFSLREGQGSFRGWLRTILRNSILDEFRNRKRGLRGRGGDGFANLLEELHRPLTTADSQRREQIDAVVRRYCPNHGAKTIASFIEFGVYGRLASDVAAELGIAVNSVYRNTQRVCDCLRERFPSIEDWRDVLREFSDLSSATGE